MGKGKPRHNPRKPANMYGNLCSWDDGSPHGECGCMSEKCGGNPHNCCKVRYQMASIQRKFEQRTGCKNIQRYRWEKLPKRIAKQSNQ